MSAMTKKEWMEYLEKTWDAAQKEAWSEPEFECPRCGHCCQSEVSLRDHFAGARMQEEIDELRQALKTEQKTAVSPGKGTGFNYFRELDITVLRQAQEPVGRHEPRPTAWKCQCGRAYTVTCISSKPKEKNT